MSIQILDCTLRDGGYVNNWQFGRNIISNLVDKLADASIELIECGFLSQTKDTDEDKSIYRTISEAEEYFKSKLDNLVLMINCGEYNPVDIEKYTGGPIKTIRIAFHKHQCDEARKLCKVLKENGYTVFFQPMFTQGYSDIELLELINKANEDAPDAFYIVDTFGTMRKNDVLRTFYLLDKNLRGDIKIGFHSHNNLQLSFSNAQELISMRSDREIVIDTSVFGMGRGAGNLCTELLTQYVNENITCKYNLIPILEIMDEFIIPIYSKRPWGYSAPYYIAAINNCHPNYATYLMNRQSLCVRDINAIIESIPEENKRMFNSELINDLYITYQKHNIDDSKVLEQLFKACNKREVLLLAPGKSLDSNKADIDEYIREKNPVVFVVNHIPKKYNYDFVFISNLRRFKHIDEAVSKIGDKLICTSNILCPENVYMVNYSSYLNENDVILDNAGLMLINLLMKAGITDIALAGYDGFKYAGVNNYCDDKMSSNVNFEKRNAENQAIIEYFLRVRENTNIKFITPSMYDNTQ